MEILIDLLADDKGIIYGSERTRNFYKSQSLLKLLIKLEEKGYQINTLYGKFVFDEANKRILDCGLPGAPFPLDINFVNALYNSNCKLAVIYPDKKYIVFANRFFLAIHFCHMRRVLPLTVTCFLNNFEDLLFENNNTLLNTLYLQTFEEKFGKNAEPKSYILNDYKLHTEGYSVPVPNKLTIDD